MGSKIRALGYVLEGFLGLSGELDVNTLPIYGSAENEFIKTIQAYEQTKDPIKDLIKNKTI